MHERFTTEDLIEPLSPKQRAHLRSLAHHLKPIHQIGKEGLSEGTIRSVREAFNTREILKVKVQDAAPLDVRQAGQALTESVPGAHLVQTIGKTAVLYRPHPSKPEIRLPA